MKTASTFSKELLLTATSSNASDIHFFPRKHQTHIFFRIHGKRTFHTLIPNKRYEMMLSYYKFTSGMDIGEVRKPQNGTVFFQDDENHHFSLRLSTLPVTNSESLAIRILPQTQAPQLEKLFLFPHQLNRVKQWLSYRSGIILLTGPTGSGKTTTLYALLQELLHEHSLQAITLEDPIEKEMDNLIQVQVNEKAGISYHAGLKAALRHDPDILMIGEIRDHETARFAFHAALTGHLVLSTLHAKNGSGTIHRLLEMGIPQRELQQVLKAVASLQLLPIELGGRKSRAAIMELLENESLTQAINGLDPAQKGSCQSFAQLRRKAFAYGYSSKQETLTTLFTSP
ncbi:competence type IV pilus ATPase ComGA [Sediminibacillus albus]|uniref:Competence protein ComGA n=1 Tax=Sediminibacillus albus TaxID=407036 RepID=A0A1G9CU60_9BACI|nr:competence type IV pilus ATPase ComGA [Sediminibacillus albus]SDK55203.1 competence protein ComGA [Sediminibacillus albus]